ncbi:hypothetical protein N7499_001799 [Penicillium canescens]|uniref:Uncharacterized protein n=1 Tax=Penicillium canescens TaxID=5083 RepID=A0AAD6I706_PENCN|nr:uncharacterized protein N7446_009345 [Penicillium canescens]KAJ5981188.1 hypothetical protein N7522_013609 [Penicillium canescens]KAJ6034593.1 hypothetical protein N7460_008768 [Penicillium canescens]KAJ6046253.1 hypothetical protein N7444_007507 [Penicillium canescens]KAJ6053333.1 hypothetical protein N7446_009345 [Penicillium canescens]KAJ6097425.1 hypothetical protein N7499_001799 [Penicillium canescens]
MPSDNQFKRAMSLIEADKTKVLGLTVGSCENVQPGQFVPRSEAQAPPKLTFSSASPTRTYLVVSLDMDAPFPSFSVLGPILHWIQSEVKVGDSSVLGSEAPFVANYIGPAPPPGSAPHRYIFFLYEQPEGFDHKDHSPADGKELGLMGRIRYDFDAWAEKINLGPPVAFNWFVSN